MPQKYLRRISRQYRRNQQAWYLRPFAPLLRHPKYFAVNRRSVAGAAAIGAFISMLPFPGHTALAILIALLFGCNLGVAALAAWLNSPLTMLPVFYLEYRLGALLLGLPTREWPEEFNWAWIQAQLSTVWKPLFLGAFIAAAITALLLYTGISLFWRWSTARRLRERQRRQERKTG